MTEDEAKTKWCPMVRANDWAAVTDSFNQGLDAEAIANAIPANRTVYSDSKNGVIDDDPGMGIDQVHACIGSACMMWRWATAPFSDKPIGDLELTVRSENVLRSLNIATVSELCARSNNELLGTPNMGRKSLGDITDALARLGLRLGKAAPSGSGYCGLAGKP